MAIAAAENSLSNGGFESPVLAAHSYTIAPAGSGWQFSGVAGVSTNGSAFTNGSAKAPDGAQVAFIKNNAGISQAVYFDAGTYNISFLAAQRADYQTQNQTNRGPGQRRASRFDHALRHQLHCLTRRRISRSRPARNRSIPGHGPLQRRQHGLPRQRGDQRRLRHQRRQLRATGLGREGLPGHARRRSWQFTGDAGVSGNGSAFTTGNPNAPDGSQVAFLKNNATMSQSVYLAAGFYNLSFMAAQRDKSPDPVPVAGDPGRWQDRRHGHAFRHHLRLVRDVEFHGRRGDAYHRVRRSEPQGRHRQHGLH